MAQTIIWSHAALDDIDILRNLLAETLSIAQNVVESIFVVGDSLVEQPESGRIVPELNDTNVRERFIYSYRLVYENRGADIYIMGVIHGQRLLESVDRFN